MAEHFWDTQVDYLLSSRVLYHNDDYLRFLVRDVWMLEGPVSMADFGCGFGFMGLKLLPLLADGSRYTGMDASVPLLQKARGVFGALPYAADFIESDVYDVPVEAGRFDVTVCHALLLHLERPLDALREMARVTRPGGLVVACEPNWNAAMSLIRVGETETSRVVDLGFLQKLWERDRAATGHDGTIGSRLPGMFHALGLKNVGCRISDRATVLLPPVDTPEKEAAYAALCSEGLAGFPKDEEGIQGIRARLMGRGFTAEEAEGQVERERLMTELFLSKGRAVPTFFATAMSFTYGRK